jgi:methyltransferase family protein
MYLRPLVRGVATYVPGLRRALAGGTGGTQSARYCYSVWLRHLVMAARNGLPTAPEVVAELGPGDSLGIGLCAVLTGARRYLGLDAVPYARPERNLEVFDELVELLRSRTSIPDEQEYPLIDPRLESYDFPEEILTAERLRAALSPERVDAAREALTTLGPSPAGDVEIGYAAPWQERRVIQPGSVDLILSQAVLEHVADLSLAYGATRDWLKPGGAASHAIDFRSHTYAREWNGHWGYSDAVWRVIVGNRPFLLNREPLSTHLELLHRNDFEVVYKQTRHGEAGIARPKLAPRFRGMSEEDLTTQSAFLQVRRGSQ